MSTSASASGSLLFPEKGNVANVRMCVQLFEWVTSRTCPWAGEMAQQLGTAIALKEDSNLVPITHIASLTTTCNSGSRRSDTFWPARVPSMYT